MRHPAVPLPNAVILLLKSLAAGALGTHTLETVALASLWRQGWSAQGIRHCKARGPHAEGLGPPGFIPMVST